MNFAELERKLIVSARATLPSESVPYAFEKRILAHIAAHPIPDSVALWARALWCAAAPCVAVMLLLGSWSFFASAGSTSSGDLSQQFENIVLAAVDQEPPTETVE